MFYLTAVSFEYKREREHTMLQLINTIVITETQDLQIQLHRHVNAVQLEKKKKNR